jgi:hypothetical protein
LIPYARASSNYSDFLKRHLHLRNRLLDQDYEKIRLPAKYRYRKLWMYHIFVFMFDLNIIYMSCEYDWYWKISAEKIRLIRSLKKFIFRYQDRVEIYSVSAEKIISDAFSYSEKEKLVYCCTCLENLWF